LGEFLPQIQQQMMFFKHNKIDEENVQAYYLEGDKKK
jgi:hypothetical protein